MSPKSRGPKSRGRHSTGWKPPRDRREVVIAALASLTVIVLVALVVWFVRPNRESTATPVAPSTTAPVTTAPVTPATTTRAPVTTAPVTTSPATP